MNANNKSDSPSTTPKGGRDRACNSPVNQQKRTRKPTPAQRDLIDMKEKATDQAVNNIAGLVEDLLLVTRPNNDEDTEEVCDAADSLVAYSPNTRRMYERYMNKWKDYVKEKKIKNETNDVTVRDFFKSLRGQYAPSTLWVIYSCVNTYFQETHGTNLKNYSRLQRYMKAQSSKYVCAKSKTFSAEELDAVLTFCQDSEDPKHHLLGVGVALMYYGLLRVSDVLKVQVQNVSVNNQKKIVVKFEHARKRVNPGFTYHIPSRYYSLFSKYFGTFAPFPKPEDRYLKNWNKHGKNRYQPTGKHTVEQFVKGACNILNKSPSGYTSHAFRRSAATNLADSGVSFVNLKRHGQWKSDAVVEGYIANSKPLRLEREEGLLPTHAKKQRKQATAPPLDPPNTTDTLEEDDYLVDLAETVEDPGPLPLSLVGFSQIEGTDPQAYEVMDVTHEGHPIVTFSQTNSLTHTTRPSRTTNQAAAGTIAVPSSADARPVLPPPCPSPAALDLSSLIGHNGTVFHGCTVVLNVNNNTNRS